MRVRGHEECFHISFSVIRFANDLGSYLSKFHPSPMPPYALRDEWRSQLQTIPFHMCRRDHTVHIHTYVHAHIRTNGFLSMLYYGNQLLLPNAHTHAHAHAQTHGFSASELIVFESLLITIKTEGRFPERTNEL